MAIQNDVDGAAGRNANIVGQFAQQPLPQLSCTPRRFFPSQGHDNRFELTRKLVGVAIVSARGRLDLLTRTRYSVHKFL